ncbi:MAG TPA: hypothetical protein VHC69_18165 [Polyangiaceae bacterium]|nr:hypothetical protein [Polyangiaceae bacterium]
MNRDDHRKVGILSGVAAVCLNAARANRSVTLGELVGGALSGMFGAAGPDVFEPADHPHHRQVAHSAVTLMATTGYVLPRAADLQNKLATEAQTDPDPLRRFLTQFVAGASAGAPAGYASHLVADATTPRSIPFLGKF